MDIDYNNYHGFDFIKYIMTESTLKREEREKFYRKVAIPYMKDTKFRDKVHVRFDKLARRRKNISFSGW
jgi:hypothetical protein